MRLPCIVLLLLLCVNCRFFGAETIGLYSDDRKIIIEYLREHPVPDVPHFPSGPVPGQPEYRAEVKRAIELFKGGDAELRLAIAKSLEEEGVYDLWALCGDDDRDAKHYLAGLALGFASADKRERILEWLRKSAHPSLASVLLRSLKEVWLCEGLEPQEQDSLLEFLSQMYRQPGLVQAPLMSRRAVQVESSDALL